MTRAELTLDLTAVARSLVLVTAVLESLATSLQSPQEGLDLEDDPAPGPVPEIPLCRCQCCADERARGVRP